MHSQIVFVGLALCLAVAVVNSENAFYIPRSFYVIDAAGHQSAKSVIGARHQNAILHRLKRAAAPSTSFSSSSVSSSSSSNGGPVFFQQSSQQSHGVVPNYPVNYNNQAGANYAAAAGGLDNRFDDGQYYAPVPSTAGVFQTTSGIVLPNGQVQYETQSGRF